MLGYDQMFTRNLLNLNQPTNQPRPLTPVTLVLEPHPTMPT